MWTNCSVSRTFADEKRVSDPISESSHSGEASKPMKMSDQQILQVDQTPWEFLGKAPI